MAAGLSDHVWSAEESTVLGDATYAPKKCTLTRNSMNSLWKTVMLASLLLVFVCIGIAHVINPDWFIKRSGVRKGGDLLNDWNRFGFQIAGVLFAGFAAYLLYALFRQ